MAGHVGTYDGLQSGGVFTSAAALAVELWSDTELLAPDSGVTSPPQVSTTEELPLWVDSGGNRTTTPMAVTDVSVVKVALRFQKTEMGQHMESGTSVQSDIQAVDILLRNKPGW